MLPSKGPLSSVTQEKASHFMGPFDGALAGRGGRSGGRSGGQQLELPLINQRDGHSCNKNVPN